MNQEIQDFALTVHGTPEIELPPSNYDDHLVQVPAFGRSWPPTLNPPRIGPTEFQDPSSNCLIRDVETTLGKQVLNVPIAQRETAIEPDGMLDDDRWKAVTTVGYLAHPETLKHRPCQSHAVNVTMPAALLDFGAGDGADVVEYTLEAVGHRLIPLCLRWRCHVNRHLAARSGAHIVIAMGFSQAAAVQTVAREFPDIRFTLIDMVVDLPNVQSVIFKEHEGSFLVGMAAAMASKTSKIGFVGGMDVPLIRRFALGYEEGAKHVDPDIEIFQNMTGTTPAAWNDPARGGELARRQFDRGADVVYAAAGGTGIGVYQAARDAGKLAIGVDRNQNHLYPGTMLTSMVKRVDVAVYEAFKSTRDGTWKGGTQVLGLAEEGVGWAVDEHNRSLVPADMEAAIERARRDIIAGRIEVSDYMAR